MKRPVLSVATSSEVCFTVKTPRSRGSGATDAINHVPITQRTAKYVPLDGGNHENDFLNVPQ
jgi:hypothetical protein